MAEGDVADFEEVEDELEVLEFLDGDGVELFDVGVEVLVFFEAEGGGGGLAFEVGVVHEDGVQVGFDFVQPIRGGFGAKHQHGGEDSGTGRFLQRLMRVVRASVDL